MLGSNDVIDVQRMGTICGGCRLACGAVEDPLYDRKLWEPLYGARPRPPPPMPQPTFMLPKTET